MNELIQKYWKRILVIAPFYAILWFLLLYPINLYVQTPGGLTEVEHLISVDYNEDKVTEGTISTTYIMSLNRPTFFEFMVGYLSKFSTYGVLSGSNLNYTNEEIVQISYLDKATSVDAAIIVAYEAMEAIDPSIHIEYHTEVLVYGKATYLSHYDEIAFGDEFVQMVGDGDVVVTDYSLISANTTTGESYEFTFLNADKESYTVSLTKDATTSLFGVTLKTYYIVDGDETTPSYHQADSNIGGPSGGLLQTLAIYNMLSEEDITHGLKIAGTGTIAYGGNVGYIGGVKQKIATAYLNHVDVFFIPFLNEDYYYDNYVEALRACEELGIDPTGWLVPVATFQDAIDYLAGLED
ncbi:MAG: S16 family serine protease [Candidatus Izemoplasmatales bacterium]